MMRYMRALNDWLARDVEDRQREIRSLGARIDQLRNELAPQFGIRQAGKRPSRFGLFDWLKLSRSYRGAPTRPSSTSFHERNC